MKNKTYYDLYTVLNDLKESVVMEYVLEEKTQLSVADFVVLELRIALAMAMGLINENMAMYLTTLCNGYKKIWIKLNEV